MTSKEKNLNLVIDAMLRIASEYEKYGFMSIAKDWRDSAEKIRAKMNPVLH